MSAVSDSKRTILARGLRARCPRCGVGAVFVRGFTTAETCRPCGFAFERGPGHWVGGNEITLLVTYPASVVALAVPAFACGGSWITAAVGGVLAVVIGLSVHRPARGLFFAIDYLVEPDWTRADGDDGRDDRRGADGGDAPVGPPPWPGGNRAPGTVLDLPIPTPDPRPDAEPVAEPPRVTPARD